MSLFAQTTELGSWGTMGYLGFQRKSDFPEIVFAHFLLEIHTSQFPESMTLEVVSKAQEVFGGCALLVPHQSNLWKISFIWQLGSAVRDPGRLVRAAANRFRDTEDLARVRDHERDQWILQQYATLYNTDILLQA